jgi:endonuclease/exonuclease/phosphatase family metal-dependent hydrolase
MRYAIGLILAGLVTGFVHLGKQAHAGEHKDAVQIRVMTFNILRDEWAKEGHLSWKDRGPSAVALLRDHKPDVVGLQEETAEQVAFICESLNSYTYLVPHHRNGGGLLIRKDAWHVIDNGKIKTPGNRQASWAILESTRNGQRWAVYNAHFMHDSAPGRLEAAKRIADHIARNAPRGTPVAVLGDFNAQPQDQPLLYLGGNAGSPVHLVNAFNTIHGDDDPRGTVRALSENRHGPRIDHILVNEFVMVLDVAILYDRLEESYPSDHYPVQATLEVSRQDLQNGPNEPVEATR